MSGGIFTGRKMLDQVMKGNNEFAGVENRSVKVGNVKKIQFGLLKTKD